MANVNKFESLLIDVEANIFLVNGRDVSRSGKELHLHFKDGKWSLAITEDTIYTSQIDERR